MKSEEVDYIEELNNLPVDSIRIAPYLSELKQKAAAEVSIRHLNLTDTFLIQFLQARDFDVALALKVCNTTIKRWLNSTDINLLTNQRAFCSDSDTVGDTWFD